MRETVKDDPCRFQVSQHMSKTAFTLQVGNQRYPKQTALLCKADRVKHGDITQQGAYQVADSSEEHVFPARVGKLAY